MYFNLKKPTLFLLCLVVMGSVISSILAQDPLPAHRIDVRTDDGIGEFYDTVSGDVFIPRGINYIGWTSTNRGVQDRVFDTTYYNSGAIQADFQHLSEAGYNTVRLFFDACSVGPTCIGNSEGRGLNTEYIANIAQVIQLAADEGIYLVLTSNESWVREDIITVSGDCDNLEDV